jgi:phospholipase C
VWLYDEHGGYYDHVPPPKAIKPDKIPPKLSAGDEPGAYDLYGPRVPAAVVSPYSRPRTVVNRVCDHTSVLATIESKWNLPACTFRDANASTLAPFLDRRRAAFAEPPQLAAAPQPAPPGPDCSTDDPPLAIHRRRRHHPHRRRA